MKEEHLLAIAKKYNLDIALVRRMVGSQFELVLKSIQERKSVRITHLGSFTFDQKGYDQKQKYTTFKKEEKEQLKPQE